jgi:hypothetical protein
MSRFDASRQRLLTARRAILAELNTHLDVEAGLREVLIASLHENVRADLADELDVTGGLAAIVRDSAPPPPAAPSRLATTAPLSAHQPYSARVAKFVAALPPAQRLTLRTHPSAGSFDLAAARVTYRGLGADLGNAVVEEIVRELERTLVQARDRVHRGEFDRLGPLAHALDVAHTLVHALERILDRARVAAGNLPGGPARDVARELARSLDRALTRAQVLTRDLVFVRESALDPDHPGLAEAMERSLAQFHESDPARARSLVRDLDLILAKDIDRAFTQAIEREPTPREAAQDLSMALTMALRETPAVQRTETLVWLRDALDDAVDADLREADLKEVPLAGIRWSARTQWPAGWTERIRQCSVPAADSDDVYIIQGNLG